MAKKKPQLKFNYAVGHYWEGESGSVGCYTYHNQVHYGTIKEANNFLNYIKEENKKKPVKERRDHRIFMLVEVPQLSE